MRSRNGGTRVRGGTQWQVRSQWRDSGNGDWAASTTFGDRVEAQDEFHFQRRQHQAGWNSHDGKVCVGPRYGLLVELVEWDRDGLRVVATTAPDPNGPPLDPRDLVAEAAERTRRDLA